MKIGIVSDHRGYALKEKLKPLLGNYEIVDYGTRGDESVDYPDFAFLVAEAVRDKKIDVGVAICGSGIGMSIACNKVKGIRCARVVNVEDVLVTRRDNDANMIAFSANISLNDALEMIDAFVHTPFSKQERHQVRIDKIKRYENER